MDKIIITTKLVKIADDIVSDRDVVYSILVEVAEKLLDKQIEKCVIEDFVPEDYDIVLASDSIDLVWNLIILKGYYLDGSRGEIVVYVDNDGEIVGKKCVTSRGTEYLQI